MVDIETTGLDPTKHAIIQIGAIPFNSGGKRLPVFNRCLTIPQYRKWDKETKEWWGKTNPNVLKRIENNADDYLQVLLQFRDYVNSFKCDIKFWSNHPFDWNFLNNYFKTYNVRRPYKYDAFRDVDTYIVAMVGEENIKAYKPIANKEKEHDALYDCELQIQWMLNSIKYKR